MELTRYARFLRRNAPLIIGTGILLALVAGLMGANEKPLYRASTSLILSLKDPRTPATYDYDQFYVLQTQELYSANIVAWLNSSDVSEDINAQANVSDGRVRGRKNGGTIELNATAPSAKGAADLIDAATKLITDRTKTITQGANRASFEVVPGSTLTKTMPASPLASSAVGLLSGLLLGLLAALLREGLRRRVRGTDEVTELFPHLTRVSQTGPGDALSGYRELREELDDSSGVIVVCDLTGSPGRVGAGLAEAMAETGAAVTLIRDHPEAGSLPPTSRGVTTREITESNVSSRFAKDTIGSIRKGVVVVSTGPTRANILAWQRQATKLVVAVERDKTRLSELEFAHRELPTPVRVAYL